MKVKYRVLESRYSDGSIRFFPQNHDWWYGWRFYGQRFWTSWSNSGTVSAPIWFDSLEKAEAFLRKQIDWLETFGRKTNPRDDYVHQVEEIIHKYDNKQTETKKGG